MFCLSKFLSKNNLFHNDWLILKSNLKDPKFFPMPASRNSRLEMFDLNTIINVFYKDLIDEKTWKKNLYIDSKYAYFVYCNLIKELNTLFFPGEKPYYLEMLLFAMADDWIFTELRNNVNLSISY